MKKINLLLLTCLLAMPVIGCSKPSGSALADKDFDGLYDSVDPNINSNEYSFNIIDPNTLLKSDKDVLKIDFRNLIFDDTPVYSHDVAKMSAVMSLEGYGNKEKITILNDKYYCKDSDTFPLLAQFGFTNVKYYEIPTHLVDENDKCGLFIGKHVAEINGKKTQVFGAVIKGYLDTTGWMSNIEFGSDSSGFYEVTGEYHPDWENREMHKGFDVSANRIYRDLIKYYNDNIISDGDNIIYLCGQSRGGAIANLLAKKLKDNNIKNVAYCLNPPTNTTESDNAILKSYNNIFNLRCDEDIIRYFPLAEWGFTTYGYTYAYSFVKGDHKDEYEDFFNHEFTYLSPETQEEIFNVLYGIVEERKDMYEFREPDENYPEYKNFATLEEALEYKKEVDESITNESAKVSYKTEITTGTLLKPYKVQIYTRPSILTELIYNIVININDLDIDALERILEIASEYRYVLTRYVREILTIEHLPSSVDQVNHPHMPKSVILGCDFAELVIE